MNYSKVELLSCENLNNNEKILNDIFLLKNGLFKEIGWHYYVDLIWVINCLRKMNIKPGATIVDAGAGFGLLQYLLSYYGYDVISVDFSPRKMNFISRLFFHLEIIESKSKFMNAYIAHIKEVRSLKYLLRKIWLFIKNRQINFFSFGYLLINLRFLRKKIGKIRIYQADMRKMTEIASDSIDAVVSISAIEHMDIGSTKPAIQEFNRILKKNQPMIITTSASQREDWYHQPGEGWCFSIKSLSEFFDFGEAHLNAFDNYDAIFSEYKNNSFLQKHLASMYRLTKNNGMPDGVWDPQYVPVGIIKFKQDTTHECR